MWQIPIVKTIKNNKFIKINRFLDTLQSVIFW